MTANHGLAQWAGPLVFRSWTGDGFAIAPGAYAANGERDGPPSGAMPCIPWGECMSDLVQNGIPHFVFVI